MGNEDGGWSTQPVALLLIFKSCNTSVYDGQQFADGIRAVTKSKAAA